MSPTFSPGDVWIVRDVMRDARCVRISRNLPKAAPPCKFFSRADLLYGMKTSPDGFGPAA